MSDSPTDAHRRQLDNDTAATTTNALESAAAHEALAQSSTTPPPSEGMNKVNIYLPILCLFVYVVLFVFFTLYCSYVMVLLLCL
jgi:hypothetical protein